MDGWIGLDWITLYVSYHTSPSPRSRSLSLSPNRRAEIQKTDAPCPRLMLSAQIRVIGQLVLLFIPSHVYLPLSNKYTLSYPANPSIAQALPNDNCFVLTSLRIFLG